MMDVRDDFSLGNCQIQAIKTNLIDNVEKKCYPILIHLSFEQIWDPCALLQKKLTY